MTFTDKAGERQFCEADDVRQQMNYRPKGYPIPDAEAERNGLKAYLDATGWGETAETPAPEEEKAVPQSAVEDKAVDAPAPKPSGLTITAAPADVQHARDVPRDDPKGDDEPGLHIDIESRRSRRGS